MSGLGRRQEFAMAAMAAVIAHPDTNALNRIVDSELQHIVASSCVAMADALIAALDAEKDEP